MNTNYESALGKAIDLLRNGYPLPFSLKVSLRDDQGMTATEILQLQARHAPGNFAN